MARGGGRGGQKEDVEAEVLAKMGYMKRRIRTKESEAQDRSMSPCFLVIDGTRFVDILFWLYRKDRARNVLLYLCHHSAKYVIQRLYTKLAEL